MLIEYRHERERQSTSSGKRPKQRYNFLRCASQTIGSSTMKQTQVNLGHKNHETTEEIHRYDDTYLDENDRDLVLTMKEANAKPSEIKPKSTRSYHSHNYV